MLEAAHADPAGRNCYGQRRLPAPPHCVQARRLLREIANATCHATPRPPRFPLTLYGGGDMGRMARDYFRSLGHEVALVVDRNADALRRDPFWAGVSIAHPDDVDPQARREAQLVVCVATAPFKPLETALAGEGWGEIVPFYDIAESQRAHHPLSNGWFSPPLTETDMERTAAVLERWDDDISRAHHLQFLAWRALREEWTFDGAPVTGDDRFFIPEVMALAGGHGVFVDAGAHHGQVARKFASLHGNAFDRIVAIEPDPRNAAALEASLPQEIATRTTLLRVAIGAEAGARPFHSGLGYASQFAATGQDRMDCTMLDALGLTPDFLKLHLEGAELDALKGGRETIRRHRPAIAATTYHNADGIWRTPAWLMEELEDYRFLMRLHSWCGTGAVVYALPRERAAAS